MRCFLLATPGVLFQWVEEDLLAALNALCNFRPRQWHFLRDYPASAQGDTLSPKKLEDLATLTGAGLISRDGLFPPPLTRVGYVAQDLIWQAERYVAEFLARAAV